MFKRRELKVSDQLHELGVRRRLAVLTVVVDFVLKLDSGRSCVHFQTTTYLGTSVVFQGPRDRIGDIANADLVVFVHCSDMSDVSDNDG